MVAPSLLAAVALASYLAITAQSCPLVSSVSPSSGSADPSFVYTISGAGLMGLSSLTSDSGSLNYTIVSDSTTRFSFQPGSSPIGRVVVRLLSPESTSCSPVTINIFVTIPYAPILEGNNEGTFTFRAGSNATISCSILGSSQAPAWFFNNVPIASQNSLQLLSSGLVFDSLGKDQGGWYTCAASNKYGRTERDYLVIVGTDPSLILPPNPPQNMVLDYYFQLGSTVVLPCFSSATPPAEVKWFENGQIVLDGANGLTIEPVSGSLIIDNFSTNQAKYYCTVSNVLGELSSLSNVTLNIAQEVQFTPSPLQTSYSITAPSSSDSDPLIRTLNCYNGTLFGYNFQWFRNHNLVLNGASPTLEISISSSGSGGGYYCCRISVVTTDQDVPVRDLRCTVVNVRLPPVLVNRPPPSASISTNRNINLLCSGQTSNNIDLPQFSWSLNGSGIPSGDPRISEQRDQFGVSTLVIRDTQVSDSGVYMCKGENFVNSATVSSDIRVVETCGVPNLVGNPGAEESDISGWTAFTPNFIRGENVFSITGSGAIIAQTISLSSLGRQRLRFSGRMRRTNTKFLPLITLAVSGEIIANVTPPFSSTAGWQWVGHEMELTINNSTELTVTLAGRMTGVISGASIYFDDICVSLQSVAVSSMLSPSAITSTSSTSVVSSTPPSEPAISDTVIIIAGAAGGGVVILIIIIAFIIVLPCVILLVRRKRKSKQDFTASVQPTKYVKPGKTESKDDKAISLTNFSKGSGRHHYQSDPVAQRQNPTTPEYLDLIDQSAAPAPPNAGGMYMEIDTSRQVHSVKIDEQYSYAQQDRLGNRPPVPVPREDSHYY